MGDTPSERRHQAPGGGGDPPGARHIGRADVPADGGDVSRALLALSVDGPRIGTFEVDVATGGLTWNQQVFELLGVDPGDCGGRLADGRRAGRAGPGQLPAVPPAT